ncbi:uncharacterized protein MELLADRAFT_113916 [Melampsora larici-populina 98AG31]|uniref:Uncharacterized protein n=1 Tax=Melampsora larici-populina (strain 98AG31 / pathotype 3-4-7) TaxID=747676 RepID=F4SBH2_MELLP|nr:uncharacterized protein MELLADRAFT_113916 [Melampsora larici-populina 98AG31]EGF97990.1 hypothetical protein MELLADRAFT_113916 [Melampsora larici-populina 98AG31]
MPSLLGYVEVKWNLACVACVAQEIESTALLNTHINSLGQQKQLEKQSDIMEDNLGHQKRLKKPHAGDDKTRGCLEKARAHHLSPPKRVPSAPHYWGKSLWWFGPGIFFSSSWSIGKAKARMLLWERWQQGYRCYGLIRMFTNLAMQKFLVYISRDSVAYARVGYGFCGITAFGRPNWAPHQIREDVFLARAVCAKNGRNMPGYLIQLGFEKDSSNA